MGRPLCEEPKIRRQRRSKLVHDRVRTPRQVLDLLVEVRGELFGAGDSDHEYWMDVPDARPYVQEVDDVRGFSQTTVRAAPGEQQHPGAEAGRFRVRALA